jgi:fumarate hydratase class I
VCTPLKVFPVHRWLRRLMLQKVEVLEYPELGMEAVWKIEVENFPAFIVVDDKGNDFFKEWQV